MKVIATNIVTGVTATSEDANYPASNLLDQHPKRLWKANNSTVDSVTLTVSVNGLASGLGMFGITADSASVSISDPNACEWASGISWATGIEWNETTPDLNVDITWITGTTNNSMWVDFDQFNSVVDISVTLHTDAGSAETIAAGVVYAGEVESFRDPSYGLSEGLHDYSIVRELSNGSFYYKNRDRVRTFAGELLLERDTAFYTFMHTTCRANGLTPMAWKVADALGNDGAVYARFSDMPQGSHSYPQWSSISFSLIEVL